MSLLTEVRRAAADAAARTVIAALLRETGGNLSAAARALGLDAPNLRREMRRVGVDLGELRASASPESGCQR